MIHQNQVSEEWEVEGIEPFNELMLTWNGKRPFRGLYRFYVSVKRDEWSPWLLYATWGSEGQSSYLSTPGDVPVRVYQDAVEVMEGKATGFKIRVGVEGDAELVGLHGLHVYTNGERKEISEAQGPVSPIYLPVRGLSQMALDHPRHKDLCSPTSTAAIVRYLSGAEADPVDLASKAWDGGFDIYGNWVFNVVEAVARLGSGWHGWVERLGGFDEVVKRLESGTPVIVSVRGPLAGGALPYAKGHLLAVIGVDPVEKKVICMDPAFARDEETEVRYDLSDFVQAWNRRGRIAYVFSKLL